MIYYLPLEHLDKRYTKDLDVLFENEFKRQKKQYVKIDGKALLGEIKVGAFLDSDSTNYFKFSQLQEVCRLFKNGTIKNGDTFFVSDLWFPGIECIPYMAYFHNIKVSIKGILHAGSWTETDYVAGMKEWAEDIEKGWLKFFDTVFVGSDWIKREMLEKGRISKFGKVINTGLPFDPADCYVKAKLKPWSKRNNLVLFTGSLDDEKQPWLFEDLAKRFSSEEVVFLKTMDLDLSKKEYYDMLSGAKVVFSAALQENFGYSMLEACAYGVNIVVPDRLAYREKYPSEFRYKTLDEAEQMIRKFLKEDHSKELINIANNQKQNTKKIVSLI